MNKKGKLILAIVVFVAVALVSNFVGATATMFSTNLTGKIDFSNVFKYSSDKLALIITAIGTIILSVNLLWLAFKYNYFSSYKMLNKNDRAETDLYGSARFMTTNEMTKEFGQMKNKKYSDYNWNELGNSDFEGYVVKSYKKKGELFVQKIKQQHCLIIGTNGTGKSYYFLMPTIEANALSKEKPTMIINDLKGELFLKTSKSLQDNGYNVICLNLRTPRKSTRFNPLEMIWNLYHEYLETGEGELIDKVSQYIIEISAIIVPPNEGTNKEFFDGAQGILSGILWGMLEDSKFPGFEMTKDKFTFAQISNIINKQRERFMDFLTHRDLESKVWDYASMIIGNESEKTVAGYVSTLQTCLKPFLEEGITYLTSASDFDLEEMSNKPSAIFLIIPDESAARYIIAITMIVQIYNYLTYKASTLVENNYKLYRTHYFLLDEFGNMPKIANFAKYISTSRGRNIFFCPIVQATSQLKTMFSEAEATTIQDQCHLKIFMGSNEFATLEYFQKQLGTYSVYTRSSSVNDKTTDSLEYQGTTSVAKKELVTIDELQYKSRGLIYFTLNSKMPSKSNLVPFFDDELKNNKVFVEGSIENNIKEKKLEFLMYNLSKREKAYVQGDGVVKTNEDIASSENEENNQIVDLTENEYNSNSQEPLKIDLDLLRQFGLAADDDVEVLKKELDD